MDIRERNINDIDWLEKNVNIVPNDELFAAITANFNALAEELLAQRNKERFVR